MTIYPPHAIEFCLLLEGKKTSSISSIITTTYFWKVTLNFHFFARATVLYHIKISKISLSLSLSQRTTSHLSIVNRENLTSPCQNIFICWRSPHQGVACSEIPTTKKILRLTGFNTIYLCISAFPDNNSLNNVFSMVVWSLTLLYNVLLRPLQILNLE